MRILCLGNEFIEEDSFAKKIGKELEKDNYRIVYVEDFFQLIELLNSSEEFIIFDVVKGIGEVCLLNSKDLENDRNFSMHDLGVEFALKLLEKEKTKILGIPIGGDIKKTKKQVKKIIQKLS